jgi:hypothetical protein
MWTKSEKLSPEGSSSTGLANTTAKTNEIWSTRRGHVLTFVALFLYTAIALFRPYELSPALAWTITLPYWMAIGMLVIFIPSQFAAEGLAWGGRRSRRVRFAGVRLRRRIEQELRALSFS